MTNWSRGGGPLSPHRPLERPLPPRCYIHRRHHYWAVNADSRRTWRVSYAQIAVIRERVSNGSSRLTALLPQALGPSFG
jgi:hypothetical protein